MINVQVLSQAIFETSSRESSFYPIDRIFVENYLELIMAANPKEFVLFNLKTYPQTYVNQLLYCIPEVWANFTTADWQKIIVRLGNVSSLISVLVFTYKYLKIDLITYFVKLTNFPLEIKQEVLNYFIGMASQLFLDSEEKFQDVIDLGIDIEYYVKQLNLNDGFIHSVSSTQELAYHLMNLQRILK